MRKLVYTTFVAFWAATGMLLALHLLSPNHNPAVVPEVVGSAIEPAGETAGAVPGPAHFTLQEIARHDRLEDCWMAIEGSVFNLTDYIPRHPTRPELLESWCGTDATAGMRTKGNDSDHSPRAWRMLERYRIGDLVAGESAG